MSRTICVVGTGYVGMACVVGFAELGWRVHGYDTNWERIERLQLGILPYDEPGLSEMLRARLASGSVHFFNSIAAAARDATIVIITVGTPARDDGSADISAIKAAIDDLATVPFAIHPTIVVRSTVPPGTCDALAVDVAQWADLIYVPEFLREGSAVRDFLNPDRIVVGCESPVAGIPYVSLVEQLHKPVMFTSRSSAEVIKCCSNAFLALKISFANEVANLCDAVGATSDDVLRAIGYDRRIGTQFLRPGIGFGGPCFAKDVKSIAYVAGTHGLGHELFSATLRVNEAQPRRIVEILEREVGQLAGSTIGVWGLAFKAGTDDIRDSLALRIVADLGRRGARTIVYDPAVHLAPLPVGSRMALSALEATRADALLVLTEWPEFARIDPRRYANSILRRVVVDGRNVLDPARVAAAGLRYRGVGRGLSTNDEGIPLESIR